MFLSHDEDNEREERVPYYEEDADEVESDQDVYPHPFPPPRMPPLSRQSSIGSNSGPRPPFARKRANSLSAMPPPPPPFMMDLQETLESRFPKTAFAVKVEVVAFAY